MHRTYTIYIRNGMDIECANRIRLEKRMWCIYVMIMNVVWFILGRKMFYQQNKWESNKCRFLLESYGRNDDQNKVMDSVVHCTCT